MEVNIWALKEAVNKFCDLVNRKQLNTEEIDAAAYISKLYKEKLRDCEFADDCLSREKRKARARRQPKRGKKENQATFILTPAVSNVKGVFEHG